MSSLFIVKKGHVITIYRNKNGGMSSLFIDQSRAYHVIITWVVRVRTLRPESVANWPDSVAK